ncbi:hypothetical protein Ahy_B09g099495 [Arachis hypogaea]|uniref:PEP-utilising enzyme C-terminal domain-containing protein n=1 Tax=Arachis hypogaea TaxID=3818 RepID=A0A444XUT5_ARAHY|nr:hypothetical protein Ahy_B09g099495 [Arachis hypogaea]
MDGLLVTIRLLDPPLHEFIPKGISYPELTEMHFPAIFEAAVSVSNLGIKGLLEIMELKHQVSLIRNVDGKVFSETSSSLSYKVGTMIDVPRATLIADEIAEEA